MNSLQKSKSNNNVKKSSSSTTLLMRAVVEDDISILVRLLSSNDYTSTLFVCDKKGRTALDWARMCRNYQAVSLLTKAMSTVINNSRISTMQTINDLEGFIMHNNDYQHKELLHALKNRDQKKAIQILRDNRLHRMEVEGLNLVYFTDKVGHSGYTPLIMSAGFNMIEVIDLLIEHNAPVNHANKFGHTAFTYACSAGNSDIARMLLFHGANIHHCTVEGRSGLHFACIYNKARTVKVIIKYLLETFATFRIQGLCNCDNDVGDDGYDDDDDDDDGR